MIYVQHLEDLASLLFKAEETNGGKAIFWKST